MSLFRVLEAFILFRVESSIEIEGGSIATLVFVGVCVASSGPGPEYIRSYLDRQHDHLNDGSDRR